MRAKTELNWFSLILFVSMFLIIFQSFAPPISEWLKTEKVVHCEQCCRDINIFIISNFCFRWHTHYYYAQPFTPTVFNDIFNIWNENSEPALSWKLATDKVEVREQWMFLYQLVVLSPKLLTRRVEIFSENLPRGTDRMCDWCKLNVWTVPPKCSSVWPVCPKCVRRSKDKCSVKYNHRRRGKNRIHMTRKWETE